MWENTYDLDLFEQVPELAVPVYFVIGRHDYNTPSELVERPEHTTDVSRFEKRRGVSMMASA